MRWLGCAAIALCIPLLMESRWVYFPLGANLSGAAFALFAYTRIHPRMMVASFGVLSAVPLAISGVGCVRRKPAWICGSGGALVVIGFWSFLRVAVVDAGLLARLAHELEWWQTAFLFAGYYLPGSQGGEPTIWALEATGPNGIFRNGVTKEDVKVGDNIKARCHLLRDGSPGCLLGFVTPQHGDKARGDGVEHQWD